jgi:hypothetical protein
MIATPSSVRLEAVGRTVGRYTVGRALGSGRFCDAFLAKLVGVEGFERELCLKLLRLEAAVDASARARLLDAARASAGLSHAAVLQVVDVGVAEWDGEARPFVACELARGPSLAQVIAQRDAWPLAARLAVLAELVRALEHAHRADAKRGAVVHGSLDARQVFVTARGEVKLGDFALGAAIEGRDASADDDRAALFTLLRMYVGESPRIDPEAMDATDLALSGERLVLAEALAVGRRLVVERLDLADVHDALLELSWRACDRSEERAFGPRVAALAEAAPPTASETPSPSVLLEAPELAPETTERLRDDRAREDAAALLLATARSRASTAPSWVAHAIARELDLFDATHTSTEALQLLAESARATPYVRAALEARADRLCPREDAASVDDRSGAQGALVHALVRVGALASASARMQALEAFPSTHPSVARARIAFAASTGDVRAIDVATIAAAASLGGCATSVVEVVRVAAMSDLPEHVDAAREVTRDRPEERELLALLAWNERRLDEARERFDSLLAERPARDDVAARARILGDLALVHLEAGRLDRAFFAAVDASEAGRLVGGLADDRAASLLDAIDARRDPARRATVAERARQARANHHLALGIELEATLLVPSSCDPGDLVRACEALGAAGLARRLGLVATT